MNELIQMIFATRNAAHVEHWKTTNGWRHAALGDFYEGVIELLDKLVEASMGAFGVVDPIPKDAEVKDIVKRLQADMMFMSQNRHEITQGLPALDNILQEVEGLYLKTLFKLERLK